MSDNVNEQGSWEPDASNANQPQPVQPVSQISGAEQGASQPIASQQVQPLQPMQAVSQGQPMQQPYIAGTYPAQPVQGGQDPIAGASIAEAAGVQQPMEVAQPTQPVDVLQPMQPTQPIAQQVQDFSQTQQLQPQPTQPLQPMQAVSQGQPMQQPYIAGTYPAQPVPNQQHAAGAYYQQPIAQQGVPGTNPMAAAPVADATGSGGFGFGKGNDASQQDGKAKKPFYKRWWFWAIVIVLILGGIGSCSGDPETESATEPVAECEHEWEEATCTEPETCSKCDATQGEALGHDYSESTCTEEGVCSRCGESSGEKGEHVAGEWKATKKATCQEAGEEQTTCTVCGDVMTRETELADHTPGEWEVTKKATASSAGEKTKSCTVCGEVLDTRSYELSAKQLKKAYKKECESYDYKEIARYPDKYAGSDAVFYGQVVQVMQDGNSYTLRVNTTNDGYGWYDDTILVSYTAQDGEAGILEDDMVYIYGMLGGNYTYESVLGAEITVPIVYAEYIDLDA